MSSKHKFNVSISFNQIIEGLHLTLVDAEFNSVLIEGNDHLNLELFQGIYQLKANFIDYYQEYILLVDSDKNYHFDFNYPSVAPILSFKTTHEYFSYNAEYYSKNQTIENSVDKPNFLFFGAKYDKNLFKNLIPENYLCEYTILDCNNKLLIELNKSNSKFDNEFGWFSFSNKLEIGLYFLKWKTDEDSRIFPFYIYENYQTQFFIRYNQHPDFENSFFFYSNRMEFSKNAHEYLTLDKIMYAYKDYNNYKLLTDKDKFIIRHHPFLVTLVCILQHILNIEKPDFLNEKKLLLPDFNLVTKTNNYSNTNNFIPIISAVMSKYALRYEKDTLTFKPASIIDRVIDHLKIDIFWNNFSKIDDIPDWESTYTALLKKSRRFSINSKDNQFTKARKIIFNLVSYPNKKIKQERFDTLVGNITEDIESKINDTINSIGDVSKIAAKLNLPPTRVLRNYDAYKKIYDKLK